MYYYLRCVVTCKIVFWHESFNKQIIVFFGLFRIRIHFFSRIRSKHTDSRKKTVSLLLFFLSGRIPVQFFLQVWFRIKLISGVATLNLIFFIHYQNLYKKIYSFSMNLSFFLFLMFQFKLNLLDQSYRNTELMPKS